MYTYTHTTAAAAVGERVRKHTHARTQTRYAVHIQCNVASIACRTGHTKYITVLPHACANTKSDHSAEYGSSNTRQLGTYKIMYKNKSKQFLLIFDYPRVLDNS